MTTSLAAGQHPAPLDQVHAQLGTEGLYRHLADDHGHTADRRLGVAVAQHAHRLAHADAPELSDTERAVVARFDAGEDAPESWEMTRERMVDAVMAALPDAMDAWTESEWEAATHLVDAAIAAISAAQTGAER